MNNQSWLMPLNARSSHLPTRGSAADRAGRTGHRRRIEGQRAKLIRDRQAFANAEFRVFHTVVGRGRADPPDRNDQLESSSTRAEALVDVAALWMPDRPEIQAWFRALLDAVYVAVAEDQSFIVLDGEVFDEYTFDEPDDLAQPLLDCLASNDHLAGFDWRSSPEEIRRRLESLPSCPGDLSWDWYPAFARANEGLSSGDLAKRFLEALGEHAYGRGTALLAVDTLSDSYAVTLMPTDLAERIASISYGWAQIVRSAEF
ncbi:hypothetical protein [Nocardia sp. NPDC057668]|uniref:DUF6630 family protein n=1 Tax=Nocardia sp. NPDC057668 TaxID=3346202 RepID=UPI00366DBB16